MYEYIKEFLKTNEVEFLENKSLRSLTTVKIGGNAAILTYPKDEAQFMSLVSFLRGIGAKFTVLGRMSNVLPPDDGYDDVIIKTDRMSNFTVSNNTVTASAGVGLPNLSRRAISLGIGGFEELSGIPGSVGGAVAGNAGAFGRECSELLVEALICDFNSGESYMLKNSELKFDYRTSLCKNENCFILSAKFEGFCGDINSLRRREAEFISKRKATQPYGYPSLGSVFKRPPNGVSAGCLIDECGLKGYRVGDAQISAVHAGFIVNLGEATARDYLKCAEDAASCVKERFGIELQKEIVIL